MHFAFFFFVYVKENKCKRIVDRCTLCLQKIEPGDEGWRKHLLIPPGCPKNDRQIIQN